MSYTSCFRWMATVSVRGCCRVFLQQWNDVKPQARARTRNSLILLSPGILTFLCGKVLKLLVKKTNQPPYIYVYRIKSFFSLSSDFCVPISCTCVASASSFFGRLSSLSSVLYCSLVDNNHNCNSLSMPRRC